MKFKVILIFLFLSSCATEQVISNKKAEEISFSIASVNNKNSNFALVGSSLNCVIKWDVAHGILTHRMNCPKVSEDELWAYLLGMSSKLKSEYKRDIYYLRFTTKDFPQEENKVARMFLSSKLWSQLGPQNINQKKHQEFSNHFITKVIEQKGVFSIVPKALNAVGYRFVVDEVKVKDFVRLKNLPTLKAKNIKVVFKKKGLKNKNF